MQDIYCAEPGNGKGYLLCEAALRLIKMGRDIFICMNGVAEERERWDALEPDAGCKLGRLVVVDREWLLDPQNYPTFVGDTFSEVNPDGFLPGAVLIVEEAHLYFANPRELDKEAGERPVHQRILRFFRQHRHFVKRLDDGSVQEPDILLDTQDLISLHPSVRRQTRRTYVPENLVDAGLANRIKLYKYKGARVTGRHDTYHVTKDMRVHQYYHSVKGGAPAGVHKVDSQKRGGTWRWYHLGFPALAIAGIGTLVWVGPDVLNIFSADGAHAQAVAAPIGARAAPAAPPGTRLAKPECVGSGITLDLEDRTAFVGGVWVPAKVVQVDAGEAWDVGDCVFFFGGS